MNQTIAAPETVDAFRERARDWLAQAEIPDVPLDYDQAFAVLRDW